MRVGTVYLVGGLTLMPGIWDSVTTEWQFNCSMDSRRVVVIASGDYRSGWGHLDVRWLYGLMKGLVCKYEHFTDLLVLEVIERCGPTFQKVGEYCEGDELY